MSIELSEQEQLRRQSLAALRELGIDPYPAARYEVTATAREIADNYDEARGNYQDIRIAGRIMSRRIMGSASFFELQDHTGRIQVYIRRDDVCPEGDPTLYNTVFKKLLDIGDFIGVEGFAFHTNTGELSVHCRKFTVLSKSIRPLPVVKAKDGQTFDAFTDPEFRYRQRYADLIANPEVRETFRKRTKIIQTFRRVLDAHGTLEVQTPILSTIAGGANARPFVTHHNTLDIDMYMRIATELHLKRLVVGMLGRVYEIGQQFRNEGMDQRHNPEFTSMEVYWPYGNYVDMMNLAEELIVACADELGGRVINYQGTEIDLNPPFRRATMAELVNEHVGIDFMNITDEEARRQAALRGLEINPSYTRFDILPIFFEEYVEENLIQPTFVIGHRHLAALEAQQREPRCD